MGQKLQQKYNPPIQNQGLSHIFSFFAYLFGNK